MKTEKIIGSPIGIPLAAAAISAFSTTVYENIKEMIFHGSLTPWESHTMTIAYSAVIAGLIAWFFTGLLQSYYQKVKDIEILEERARTHQATMFATYHYLNNALNNLQLINMVLDKTGTVDRGILEEVNHSILKMSNELRELGDIDDATRTNIEKFINSRL